VAEFFALSRKDQHEALLAAAQRSGRPSLDRMIGALRADQWAEKPFRAWSGLARASAGLREAFYVDAPEWKAAVASQTRTSCSMR
jgi:hypothetical protein